MGKAQSIVCRNVRTHNLKGVDVTIEVGKWTAVTGVSGSGKSSLAFDTLYSESQRRFLETLGTYERQFLAGLPQGDFDSIEPVPPAIALKQSNRTADPRAVVGTSADVIYPLRVLFAGLMEKACAVCGGPVRVDSAETVAAFVKKQNQDLAFCVRFEVEKEPSEKSASFQKRLQHLFNGFLVEGYARAVVGGALCRTEELNPKALKDGDSIDLVLDLLTPEDHGEELDNRLQSLWDQLGNTDRFGTLYVFHADLQKNVVKAPVLQRFHIAPYCVRGGYETRLIAASDLDWQSALGACQTCHGLGNVPEVDVSKVVPNPLLSLAEGAIKPWSTETYGWAQSELMKACKKAKVPTTVPYEKLNAKQRDMIWGRNDELKKANKDFVSLNTFFGWLEEERYKKNSRIFLAKYRSYRTCRSCKGARIGPVGRRASAAGFSYDDLFNGEVRAALQWAQEVGPLLKKRKMDDFLEIHREVEEKLSLLVQLGLGSSSLSRRSKSLSGGEYQRVLLTRVLGNGLTDSLYVLDEPSIGLGDQEIPSLIRCLERLRDQGNTVVMVEHEPQLVRAADSWIELGPGGGSLGGEIVGLSTESPARAEPASLQLDLSRVEVPKRVQSEPAKSQFPDSAAIGFHGFSHLNCENLFVELPVGQLTVFSGPSGAGKSTLLGAGLDKALRLFLEMGVAHCHNPDVDEKRGRWENLSVPDKLLRKLELVSVEQGAMHRTVTSVPATVLGLMDELRRLFAATSEAKERGLGPSDFSFNGKGGCEVCGGRGFVKDDLFFLGEVEKVCEECNGARYRKDVLEVRFKGKNIAQWLDTSLDECVSESLLPKRNELLNLCSQLGLGQLPLGLPTPQMSGGESQRLRIAAALCKRQNQLVCLLDEPSRGLSEKDVGRLIATLQALTRKGHTVVVVEHHSAFQEAADQLLRMGPGSGADGGQICERWVSTRRVN